MARRTRTIRILLASALAAAGLTGLTTGSAHAAGEQVNIWLTTTNDDRGRNVTRGLQQQTPVNFQPGTGGSGASVTVDENTRFQTFTGAGRPSPTPRPG
jgi:glucosylceramidase